MLIKNFFLLAFTAVSCRASSQYISLFYVKSHSRLPTIHFCGKLSKYFSSIPSTSSPFARISELSPLSTQGAHSFTVNLHLIELYKLIMLLIFIPCLIRLPHLCKLDVFSFSLLSSFVIVIARFEAKIILTLPPHHPRLARQRALSEYTTIGETTWSIGKLFCAIVLLPPLTCVMRWCLWRADN